jgi:hypothetical protein
LPACAIKQTVKIISVLLVTMLAVACTEGPTSPTLTGAPGPRQTLPPDQLADLTGTVSSASGIRIANASVTVLDGLGAGRNTTTNANGEYRFEKLPKTNANFAAVASNFIEDRRGTDVNGANRLDFVLEPTPLFSRSGVGNEVFDLPPGITRLRVNGRWNQTGTSTFQVRVGGRQILSENLRTIPVYEGTHLTVGGTVEIINSTNIIWTITEERVIR